MGGILSYWENIKQIKYFKTKRGYSEEFHLVVFNEYSWVLILLKYFMIFIALYLFLFEF